MKIGSSTMLAKINSPAFWVIMTALVVAISANLGKENGPFSESTSFAEEKVASSKPTIMREGTSMPETVGVFRVVSDRIQFVERDGHRAFRCLENLMLQRVQQVIADESNETAWIVTGQVTEFKGENFLLIELLRRTK
jgi:hypothetical protein